MSSFPYRVVLFDFDGTLADSYGAIADSVNVVRTRRGLSGLPEESVRPWVGRGLEHLLAWAVPGEAVEVVVAEYRAVYAEIMVAGTRLLPGAAALLPMLQAAGCRIGVCSNKRRPFTAALVEALGLRVDAVLGPEDVARPKPAGDMLVAAMARLGGTPATTLYVGDMSVDVEAARDAGVPVWVVATGSETAAQIAAARPDRQFADLIALATALDLPASLV